MGESYGVWILSPQKPILNFLKKDFMLSLKASITEIHWSNKSSEKFYSKM